jgi:lipoate-protein ligase A
MALDEWLLDQHRLGLHPPTLRFYTWSPIALSLGYHQRRYPQDWQSLVWQGQPIDLVRRPSGGRAVLHQGDLTYAVIISGIPGTRMQVYQNICEFLIQGWRSLGIALRYGEAGRSYLHNPNCFGTATGADLVTSEGMKFIGSAQLHRTGAVLQHGSMPLHPDPVLFRQVFGQERIGLDLSECLKLDCPQSDSPQTLTQYIIDALCASAEQCFGTTLITQPLSDAEWSSILSRTTIHSPST